MFTIALDEQGKFENLINKLNTEHVFIGGVLYDDCGDSNDYDTEKKCFPSYLRNVCGDAGGVYPKDLRKLMAALILFASWIKIKKLIIVSLKTKRDAIWNIYL